MSVTGNANVESFAVNVSPNEEAMSESESADVESDRIKCYRKKGC